jgi:hypothetical protein
MPTNAWGDLEAWQLAAHGAPVRGDWSLSSAKGSRASVIRVPGSLAGALQFGVVLRCFGSVKRRGYAACVNKGHATALDVDKIGQQRKTGTLFRERASGQTRLNQGNNPV